MNLQTILCQFGLNGALATIKPLGNGLINHTWKVTGIEGDFVLQRINTNVFKDPFVIASNIRMVAEFLAANYPDYFFVAPLLTVDGQELVVTSDGYFRIFPFVLRGHTIDVVKTPEQAFEAAVQFGRLSRFLNGFEASRLTPSIPHFHDLRLRFRQFKQAVEKGNEQRKTESKELIRQLQQEVSIVQQYEAICTNPAFKWRVMHHDTKISNVLFDDGDKGLCVIDLDTLMPGLFISDVGDMMRTYLSPVSEEEKDMHRVIVRKDFYEGIVMGYLQEMQGVLTAEEQKLFTYAGRFMVYMQALRFLTDYLNNDVYYGAAYTGHNFMRAKNQFALLQQIKLLGN